MEEHPNNNNIDYDEKDTGSGNEQLSEMPDRKESMQGIGSKALNDSIDSAEEELEPSAKMEKNETIEDDETEARTIGGSLSIMRDNFESMFGYGIFESAEKYAKSEMLEVIERIDNLKGDYFKNSSIARLGLVDWSMTDFKKYHVSTGFQYRRDLPLLMKGAEICDSLAHPEDFKIDKNDETRYDVLKEEIKPEDNDEEKIDKAIIRCLVRGAAAKGIIDNENGNYHSENVLILDVLEEYNEIKEKNDGSIRGKEIFAQIALGHLQDYSTKKKERYLMDSEEELAGMETIGKLANDYEDITEGIILYQKCLERGQEKIAELKNKE